MDGLQPSSPLDRSKTCGDLTAAAAAVEPPVKRAASCPELPETKRGDSFDTVISTVDSMSPETEDIDELVREWAALKIETDQLRELAQTTEAGLAQLETSNSALRALRGGPAAGSAAAASSSRTAAASSVVVVDEPDEAEEEDCDFGGAWNDADDDDDDEPVVYRSVAAAAPPPPPLMPAYRSLSEPPSRPAEREEALRQMELKSQGKRQRSRTSEMVPMMLQPAKQSSDAKASRSSPNEQLRKLDELKEHIRLEKLAHAQLLEACRENDERLRRLRAENAELTRLLEELKAEKEGVDQQIEEALRARAAASGSARTS